MTGVDQLAGRRLYLDANVFIYALDSALTPWHVPAQALFRLVDSGRASAVTSELSLAECLVKPLRDGNGALADLYRGAINANNPGLAVAPVSRDVLIEAARLRASRPPLKLPDAIHVATAALNGCDVLVTNDAAFRAAGTDSNVALLSELVP
jgi:predicted nucleic acid-binding protein